MLWEGKVGINFEPKHGSRAHAITECRTQLGLPLQTLASNHILIYSSLLFNKRNAACMPLNNLTGPGRRDHLAGTVQAASESRAAEAVGLQLAFDDVSRVDTKPVDCPCCTPSQHEGSLAQLIGSLQSLEYIT